MAQSRCEEVVLGRKAKDNLIGEEGELNGHEGLAGNRKSRATALGLKANALSLGHGTSKPHGLRF